jgi:peptidoglycan/LPS O-acetylase OafA/YrhL
MNAVLFGSLDFIFLGEPMSTKNFDGAGNKLLGLELIRFVSALAVLLWHYQHFSFVADEPVDFVRERQPFYRFLAFFYDCGYWGVEAFWCISGFIFFWKYRYSISSGLVKSRDFFFLRFSRLYPLHFVTLMIVAVLQYIFFETNGNYFVYQNNDAFHFALQIFMASDWRLEKGGSFNGPIWSISLEVLVYLFFFYVMRLFGGTFRSVCGVLLICIVMKVLKVPTLVFNCAVIFFVGGGLAIAFDRLSGYRYRGRIEAGLTGLALAGLTVAGLTHLYSTEYFHYFFVMFVVPVLIILGARKFTVRPKAQKLIEALGNMTYSSYLIHFPLQLLIVLIFSSFDAKVPLYDNSFFLEFFAMTIGLSYLVYRFFEKPMQSAIRQMFVSPRDPGRGVAGIALAEEK